MSLQLTTKEMGLLKDMKEQEELCIRKYEDYASRAKSKALKALFTSMADTEREHLKTVQEMMSGSVTPVSGGISNASTPVGQANYTNQEDRDSDRFLCQDMLMSEKHAASLYNTSVFEFTNPVCRKVLAHIQAEEQQHGEQLYAYMSTNQLAS
jgi:rubrerythrin